ncbi:hypothetical protein H4582DRAFT_2058488 [Lactarius indigo]|nr:hypothetical protein H4582DRAFT_2058488 [Lactarius indigo]
MADLEGRIYSEPFERSSAIGGVSVRFLCRNRGGWWAGGWVRGNQMEEDVSIAKIMLGDGTHKGVRPSADTWIRTKARLIRMQEEPTPDASEQAALLLPERRATGNRQ